VIPRRDSTGSAEGCAAGDALLTGVVLTGVVLDR
jgi:hypothetical protein